jgi:DNA-binding protein HU-beta
MNKADLIKSLAQTTGYTQKSCEAMLNAFTATVIETVATGEKVGLVGFGHFELLKRKARPGRNPSTGKKLKIPAKKVPKFVPGKRFRDAAR